MRSLVYFMDECPDRATLEHWANNATSPEFRRWCWAMAYGMSPDRFVSNQVCDKVPKWSEIC